MNVARHQETVKRTLRRRGTTITLKDPNKTLSADLSVSGTVTSEAGSCTPPTPFRADLVDGEAVVVGDLETLLDASEWGTVTPAAGLVAVVGSEGYRVLGAAPLLEGDTIYAYRLHLRGTN